MGPFHHAFERYLSCNTCSKDTAECVSSSSSFYVSFKKKNGRGILNDLVHVRAISVFTDQLTYFTGSSFSTNICLFTSVFYFCVYFSTFSYLSLFSSTVFFKLCFIYVYLSIYLSLPPSIHPSILWSTLLKLPLIHTSLQLQRR